MRWIPLLALIPVLLGGWMLALALSSPPLTPVSPSAAFVSTALPNRYVFRPPTPRPVPTRANLPLPDVLSPNEAKGVFGTTRTCLLSRKGCPTPGIYPHDGGYP